jgi:hypothetical protein
MQRSRWRKPLVRVEARAERTNSIQIFRMATCSQYMPEQSITAAVTGATMSHLWNVGMQVRERDATELLPYPSYVMFTLQARRARAERECEQSRPPEPHATSHHGHGHDQHQEALTSSFALQNIWNDRPETAKNTICYADPVSMFCKHTKVHPGSCCRMQSCTCTPMLSHIAGSRMRRSRGIY